MKRSLCLLIFCFFSIAVTIAEPLEVIRQRAEAGDVNAQLKLGNLYFSGKHEELPQDYHLAVRWYTLAAQQNHPEGLFNLALCYDQALGTEKDANIAHTLYRRAAKLGIPQAALNSAIHFERLGKHEQALAAYQQAAQAKLPAAYWRLSQLLKTSDPEEAHKQLQQAAYSGHAEARWQLIDQWLKSASSNPPTAQKAFELLNASSPASEPEAAQRLGFCYEKGIGCEKNMATAEKWYQVAAQAGLPSAQVAMGYFKLSQNKDNEAFLWFKAAAKQENISGLYNLGLCYASGRGTLLSEKEALVYFEKAAKSGHPKAQYNTAIYYEKGFGTKPNAKRAFYWFKQAADQGDRNAMRAVGQYLRDGTIGEPQPEEATYYFKKALEAFKL